MLPAEEVQSLNHWSAREVPVVLLHSDGHDPVKREDYNDTRESKRRC